MDGIRRITETFHTGNGVSYSRPHTPVPKAGDQHKKDRRGRERRFPGIRFEMDRTHARLVIYDPDTGETLEEIPLPLVAQLAGKLTLTPDPYLDQRI